MKGPLPRARPFSFPIRSQRKALKSKPPLIFSLLMKQWRFWVTPLVPKICVPGITMRNLRKKTTSNVASSLVAFSIFLLGGGGVPSQTFSLLTQLLWNSSHVPHTLFCEKSQFWIMFWKWSVCFFLYMYLLFNDFWMSSRCHVYTFLQSNCALLL